MQNLTGGIAYKYVTADMKPFWNVAMVEARIFKIWPLATDGYL